MESLKIGSKYRFYITVNHEEIMITSGTLVGYRVLGEEPAVCVLLDDSHGKKSGTIRIIPIGAITAIDIIEEHDEAEKNEELYYS